MSKTKKRSVEEISFPSKFASSENNKKAKRRKTFDQNDTLDSELNINKAFSSMDGILTADLFAQKITRFGGDLSSIEVADVSISSHFVRDTSSWTKDRTKDNLPSFLDEFALDKNLLGKPSKNKGQLHTLIVTSAGLRAADIVRVMRTFSHKDNTILKLFAKHMKMEEQISSLQNVKSGIGVGTPARLSDLIENGALSVQKLHNLVIDASHIDQKKRGILDMKDTMMPLAKFLARSELKERYEDEKKPLAILFY